MSSDTQPKPATAPTMGRIVLFTSDEYLGLEFPAIVCGQQEESGRNWLVLTAFTPLGPKVECAPIPEAESGEGGRRWRWPPRV